MSGTVYESICNHVQRATSTETLKAKWRQRTTGHVLLLSFHGFDDRLGSLAPSAIFHREQALSLHRSVPDEA
jgi:hypothetical protein